MTKTVLITGASSGIGRETARLFAERGWQVAASMRSPEKETELTRYANVFCPRLDVTDPAQILQAIDETNRRLGPIDVLVNNAGYGLVTPFECSTPEQVQRQFATNVFGLMEMTRRVIPGMRARNQGVIINVASIGGRMTFPFYSLYHATKWSVEGFSESLRYELEPFGIAVKVVEPGPILTDFYTRSAEMCLDGAEEAYQLCGQDSMGRMDRFVRLFASRPQTVARVIFRAASDGKKKLRYPAGWAAGWILFFRKILPGDLFGWFVKKITLGK